MLTNNWPEIIFPAQDRERRARAVEWQLAVSKLEIQFEAEHGGGYPECLKGHTEEERLRFLRDLGFRVREQYVVEGETWVQLSGSIVVNLSGGWCARGVR